MTRLTDGDGLRHRRRDRFVQIPRPTIRDKGLSLRARGLLGLLLDLPDNWVIRLEWLAEQVETEGSEGEGREAIATALRELRRRGYYRVERRTMPDGTFRTGGAVSDYAVAEWAAEHAVALAASKAKNGPKSTPRWDNVVRVLPSGWVEGEEPGDDLTSGDTPPAGTSRDESTTETGNGLSGTGEPGTGLPESGGPGTLKRRETETREEGGDLRGNAQVSRGDEPEPPEPPRRCPVHLERPAATPCPPCGRARRAHEQWADGVAAGRRMREAEERAEARRSRGLALAELESCQLCDAAGFAWFAAPTVKDPHARRSVVCLHDAGANVRAAESRRAARNAIATRKRQPA